MLLEYQISICDARSFWTNGIGQYTKPTWPVPIHGRQFQKFFGPVKERYFWAAEQPYFSDESYYAQSNNALKINKLQDYQLNGFDHLRGLNRRLYSDGATNIRLTVSTKLEYWQRQLRAAEGAIKPGWFKLIGDFLSLRARVRGCDGSYKNPTQLYHISPSITNLYRCSSIPKDAIEQNPGELVRFGDACVFIDYLDRWGSFSFDHKNIEKIHPDFELYFTKWISKSKDGVADTFMLNKVGISNKDTRMIRAVVKRYFSELQILKSLFEIIDEPAWSEQLDWSKLWEHLLNKKALLFGGAMEDELSQKLIPVLQKNVFRQDVALVSRRLEALIQKAGALSAGERRRAQQTALEKSIDRVRTLIAKGKVDEAISFCETARHNAFRRHQDDFIVQSRRFRESKQQEMDGTISFEDYQFEINRIVRNLLQILRNIQEAAVAV
jgi:hypothetical protein